MWLVFSYEGAETHRDSMMCGDEAEGEVWAASQETAKDWWSPPEARDKQERIYVEPQREHGPACIWIWDFWPPELGKNRLLLL